MGERSYRGHSFGDSVHEFLAPCIYEGEGEMLGMAFFKSLVKQHGQQFFEPIGRTLHELGISQPSLKKPSHLWALRKPMLSYARWYASKRLAGSRWSPLPTMGNDLLHHAKFAQQQLATSALRISGVMRSHQLKLADRQCRMSVISAKLQDTVVMLVTSLYADQSDDAITRAAADTVCRELRKRITGEAMTDGDFRQVTKLGSMIADDGWSELDGVRQSKIMMPYK